ncbi:MAG TPA: hypothetical protein VGD43_03890 [Micromonospora sp.]
MLRKLLLSLSVTAGIVIAGTAMAPAQAQVGPGSPAERLVSGAARLSPEVARTLDGSGGDAVRRALSRYWTPERMKAARPGAELVGGATGQALPMTAPEAALTSYPPDHPVARTMGRIFLTLNGGNYTCPGVIVDSEGKSLVWTSGHCVSSGGVYATNWAFVPGYYNGAAPYGYWYATSLWTTTAWHYNNNDFANDVGAAIVGRVNGWRIADYLGGQGITWNRPIPEYVEVFGYNGPTLVSERVLHTGTVFTTIPAPTFWLWSFDGSRGYVNGNITFRYTTGEWGSPYYGSQVAGLYNAVRYISA